MNIPAKTLSTLTTLCDNESSRYALGGIRLEREGDMAHAVVTDGRKLVAVTWDDAETPEAERVESYEATIPLEACKAIDKAAGPVSKRNPLVGRVAIDEPSTNGKVTATACSKAGQSSLTVDTLKGRFPHWRDAIPSREFDLSLTSSLKGLKQGETVDASPGDYIAITLDPRYVADVCTALAKIGTTDDSRGVEFFVPIDGESAVVLKASTADRPKAVGVVMPLRRDK